MALNIWAMMHSLESGNSKYSTSQSGVLTTIQMMKIIRLRLLNLTRNLITKKSQSSPPFLMFLKFRHKLVNSRPPLNQTEQSNSSRIRTQKWSSAKSLKRHPLHSSRNLTSQGRSSERKTVNQSEALLPFQSKLLRTSTHRGTWISFVSKWQPMIVPSELKTTSNEESLHSQKSTHWPVLSPVIRRQWITCAKISVSRVVLPRQVSVQASPDLVSTPMAKSHSSQARRSTSFRWQKLSQPGNRPSLL